MRTGFGNLVDVLADIDGVQSVRSYSGRGMFGKNCLGVTCRNPAETMGKIVQGLLLNDPEGEYELVVERMLNNVSYDSMGYDSILYFPSIKWEEVEEEDEGEGDPDEYGEEDDGQPDEAQEWADYDPDC